MPDKELTEGFIRSRFRDLEPSLLEEDPGKSYARYISLAPATALGHHEVEVDTTPVGLPNLHAETRRVVLFSETENFTYTDVAGDAPSSTHGMIIFAEQHFIYDTDPNEHFKMWAASPTVVRVAYYG